MNFVLALHSHLPYVLNHGRWPHGSDWLCEAALDTYLPLLERLRGLANDEVPAPVTIGFTPVLANQLASPVFVRELEAFLGQRLTACDEAPPSLATTGDQALLPLVGYWRSRLTRLRELFQSINGDLVAAFRALQDQGRIEIIGSAATHGYLPLLARDESIRLQLGLGRSEHRRLFGRDPIGCWLPECAYRPAGRWAPIPGEGVVEGRPGIEEHLAANGFHYCFVDSHLARAGTPLGTYGEIPLGAERFDAERHDPSVAVSGRIVRSPYRPYRISMGRGHTVSAFVRDPRSSMQVWSRHQGYPGDQWYLEFHKIRWPGGLKLWRVTDAHADLGAKRAYEPDAAHGRVADHAAHFANLLATIAADQKADGAGVIVAPFDTELLGHWWFEGVDFLDELYRRLPDHAGVQPVTASRYLDAHPSRTGLRLARGSWGAGGDDRMWLNDGTVWTWRRLWALERVFWDAAPRALADPAAQAVLAQAARELLLAQASDWQFIISTGAAADYAEQRFTLHCDAAERLTQALASGTVEGAARLAADLYSRDDLFPDVLPAVAAAIMPR